MDSWQLIQLGLQRTLGPNTLHIFAYPYMLTCFPPDANSAAIQDSDYDAEVGVRRPALAGLTTEVAIGRYERGAPGLTRSKKLLGTKGIATRSKDATPKLSYS